MSCLGKLKFFGLDLLLAKARTMPLIIWVAAAAVILPTMTYGYMSVKQSVAIYRAVKVEREAQVSLCHAQLQSVAGKINAAADSRAAEAETAAAAVEPTPTNKAALLALCKGSASCRDRSQP